MLAELFMKPDNMKSGDIIVLMKNQLEDSYHDYYYVNSNNIALIPIEVSTKIKTKNIESSNSLDSNNKAPSSPSALDLRVIEAKEGIQNIVHGKKLIDMDSRCDLELEEIDISEDLLPYLTLVQSDVETDNKNNKEFGLPLAPSSNHSDIKQPGHIEHSAECGEVDVTTVDNGFSTVFRKACKKQIKKRTEGECQALNTQRSTKNEGKGSASLSQNGASTIGQAKFTKEVEMRKCIPKDTATGCSSPIPSTNSKTSAGKIKNGASRIVQGKFAKEVNMRKSISKDTATGCSSPIPSTNSKTSAGKIKNGASRIVQGKFAKEVDMRKSISKDTATGCSSPIPSTNSKTSAGKIKKPCTAKSISTSTSSSRRSSFQFDPIDERNWDMFSARKCRNQTELIHDFQIFRAKDNPGNSRKKRLKNIGSFEHISTKEVSCAESPIPSTIGETGERKRKLSHEDISSVSSSTRFRSNPEIVPLGHREEKIITEKENRKQKELREDFRVLMPEMDSMNVRHWDVFLAKKCRKQNKLMDDWQISVSRNNAERNRKERSKKEKSKRLSPEIGAESLIASKSSETPTGRKRKIRHENISSNSLPSSSHGVSEVDKLDNKENKNVVEKEIRKRKNELMKDFRNLKPKLDLMNEKNLDLFLAKKRQKLKELKDALQISVSRNNPGNNRNKMGKNEKCKSLSLETAIGAESSFASSSSESGVDINRKLHQENVSSNFLTSSPLGIPEVDKLNKKDNKKILEKEIRKRPNELMEDFPFLNLELDLVNERNLDMFLAKKSEKQNELMNVLQISVHRDNQGSDRKERGKNENRESLPPETAIGAKSLISSISSETHAGRKGKLSHGDISLNSLSSTSCGISEVDKLDYKDNKNIVEKENSKRQKELREDFRILMPELDSMNERNLDLFLANKSQKQNELKDALQISMSRDNPGSKQKVRGKIEKCTSLSPKTVIGTESLISSINSETRAGRKRKLSHENISSNSVTSTSCGIPEVNELDNKEIEKLMEKEIRKRQNELMKDFRLLKSEMNLMSERNLDSCLAKESRKQNELMDVLQISVSRNNPGSGRDKKEKCKTLSPETAIGTESSFASTNSETRVGSKTKICHEDISTNFLSSTPRGISEVGKLDNKYNKNLVEKESSKRQNELMEDFQILIPELDSMNERNWDVLAKKSWKQNKLMDDFQISVSGNNTGSNQKNMGKKEKCKSLLPEGAIGAESLIASTSSETREGRKSKLRQEDVSSNSLTSSPRGIPEFSKLDNREKRKLLQKEGRKKESELFENLRLLIPGFLDAPKTKKVIILIFAIEYIYKLQQNLEKKQRIAEDLKNKNKLLLQECCNLIEEMDDIPINWFRC